LENHEDVSIAKESDLFMILRSTDQEEELDPNKLTDADLFTFGYSQKTKKKKHQCTIFGPFAEGQMTNKCHVPMFRMETSKVEDFLGRTPEMHQVISYIQNKRIVNVMGIPGIGKTTLIKAIAHYLDERLLFKDGIIMLSLRNLD
jgi:AAA+ ATPase superfamily predicted ATPase